MNAGDFNKKIKLLKRTKITDEIGQEKVTFEPLPKPFWADIRTTRSSNAIETGQLQALNEKRFILRYSKRLNELLQSDKTHFRVEYKGVQYDVLGAINDDEANVTVTITAKGRE